MSSPLQTPEEIENQIGEDLRTRRLQRNLTQATLAERSGVSVNALKRLESGQGSSLRTLICVVRALDRADWFRTIAPVATINPLTLVRGSPVRQRASRQRQRPSGGTGGGEKA